MKLHLIFLLFFFCIPISKDRGSSILDLYFAISKKILMNMLLNNEMIYNNNHFKLCLRDLYYNLQKSVIKKYPIGKNIISEDSCSLVQSSGVKFI